MNREQFLQLAKTKIHVVQIDETEFYLKSLTRSQSLAAIEDLENSADNLIKASLCDDQGTLILNQDDNLEDIEISLLTELLNSIIDINNLKPNADVEAKKN